MKVELKRTSKEAIMPLLSKNTVLPFVCYLYIRLSKLKVQCLLRA